MREHATEGYFHMVAIGRDGRPVPGPVFEPQTPEAQAAWELAARMKAERRSRTDA
ncbi:hypothetical protein D3C86_1751660 [compost metagenome]